MTLGIFLLSLRQLYSALNFLSYCGPAEWCGNLSSLSCPNISAHEKAWVACYWTKVTISWCISKTKEKKYPNQKPHCKICGSQHAQEVRSHINTLLSPKRQEYHLASSRPRTGRLGSGFLPSLRSIKCNGLCHT